MARIEGVSQSQAGPIVKLVYRFGPRMMRKMTGRDPQTGSGIEPIEIWAYQPKMMIGMGRFNQAVRKGKTVDERIKNLVELKGAQMIGCEYCVDLGSQICRNSGFSDAELLALPRYQSSDLFTDREKAALDYAVAVMRTPVEVTDELFARARSYFDDRQLVEITALLTLVNLDRFNAAFGIGSAGFSEGMVCVPPDRPRGLRAGGLPAVEPPETSPQPLLRDEYVPVLIARPGIALPDLHRHAETGPAVLQVQAVVREIGLENVSLDGVIEPGHIPVPVRADRLYPAGHLHDRCRVAERRGVHALAGADVLDLDRVVLGRRSEVDPLLVRGVRALLLRDRGARRRLCREARAVTRHGQAHIADLCSGRSGCDAAARHGKCGHRRHGGGENGRLSKGFHCGPDSRVCPAAPVAAFRPRSLSATVGAPLKRR
jgi:alkylhydroperoxidase family enzyme